MPVLSFWLSHSYEYKAVPPASQRSVLSLATDASAAHALAR
jgi:hypothetical protein